MKYQLSIAALLLASACSASAQVSSHAPTSVSMRQPSAGQPSGKPVARVNDAVLTDRDLLREMYTIFPYAKQHNGGFPKDMEPEIRKGALKMIVFEELVYQDALRRKLTVSPERLNRAFRDFRKQFATEAEYQSVLKSDFKGSPDVLRKTIQRSLLIDRALKNDIENKSIVSVAEAKAYYDKNLDKFKVSESFEFQSISVMPPANPNADQQREARKKAEAFLKQAKATKSYQEFGLLAEKISEDDFRVNMGDHHAVESAGLPPQMVKAALAMQPGQVSDIIQIDSAFTIFRLNKHIPAGRKSFAEVKEQLRKNLQQGKAERLRAQMDSRLRKTAKVQEL